MDDRGFDRQRFIRGLILLLLAPVLVLLALALFVVVANRLPQSAALKTDVWPSVVMPWGQSAYNITFTGQKSQVQPVQNKPVEMLFVMDVSGSMAPLLKYVSDIAHDLARQLEAQKPGQIRFALMQFGDNSRVLTQWTAKPSEFHEGLDKMDRSGGSGTSVGDTFKSIDGLIKQSRSGASKVIVLFTDGQWGGDRTRQKIDAEALRKLGVDIYCVGVPGAGADPFMVEITGKTDRIYNPSDARDLARQFLQLAQDAVAGFTRGAQITHRIDGRHFSAPLNGTNWTVERGGTLGLLIGKVPEQQTQYAHPLVPLSAGLWNVGVEPPVLTFAEHDGKLQQIRAEIRPWLLKVTWFTLLLMLLPALLWTLAHLDFSPRKRQAVVEPPLPDLVTPSLPNRLPALPSVVETREMPIPTLFIGLGGNGRRALAAIRGDLKQAHLGRAGQPYKFLWVDLDTKEEVREIPFDDWAGYPIESSIAPSGVRQADTYLPDAWNPADHLKWFPSSDYSHVPRETLNLSEGARGDRALARLSLFQWLSRQDGLLPQLVAHCKTLERFPSPDGVRQVVILGSADGGVGSGWFVDFGRLISRIARQIKEQNADFIPEVIGVLCNQKNASRPGNLQALMLEIESALMSRAYPHRNTYAPGVPLLDQVDRENPFSCVFAASSFDTASAAAQCSDLAAVLVERHPRSSFFSQALLLQGQIVSVATHAAHVLPTQINDSVRLDLFLRLLGPDILLDIVANEQGSYAPGAVSADAAVMQLERWAEAETRGEPLQLLLSAAIDSTLSAGFIGKVRETSSALGEWLGNAFIASLNRRLHGQGETGGSWRRDLMPSEAIAVLRLLAGRLEQNTKPDLKAKGADVATYEAVDQVMVLARTAADGLEKWVRDLCRICEHAARQHTNIGHLRNNLARLRDRTYLDLEPSAEQIDRWAKQCLDDWLGTADNVAAIRQRLFLEVSPNQVVVRSCIADPQVFTGAEETAKTVAELARSLALLVPTARIEGALANLKDESRQRTALSLVDSQTTPRHVLVISPKPTGSEAERRGLEDLLREIPQPPSHGERKSQTGDDHSAIRRVELVELKIVEPSAQSSPLPFIEAAERAAEIVRLRAERKHSIDVPLFPPQLRIALANGEGFRSFARAYRAGQIARGPDQAGKEQWTLLETGASLTTGVENSLASAAANFVWRLSPRPDTFSTIGAGGDFAKLNQWRVNPHLPDDDMIVQIAVDAYEQ